MNTADPNTPNDNLTEEERDFLAGFNDGPTDGEQAAKPAAEAEGEQPEAAADEQPEGVDTPADGDQPSVQDPLDALPEELRNRFKELESANREKERELARVKNDYAAVAGRLKPLQQRLADLERSGQQQATQPQQRQQPQATQQQGHPSHLDAVFQSEKWKRYAEIFPEESESLQDVLTGAIKVTEQQWQQHVAMLNQRLEGVVPVISRLEQREQELEYREKLRVLTDPHPDYKEIDALPEFRQWLDGQYIPGLPAMIRQQMADPAYRNAVFSDPASVSEIMTAFKSSRAAQTGSTQQPTTAQAGTAKRTTDPRLSLSAAPNVRTEAAPRAPSMRAMSEEEQFIAGYNS